ncbi:hypothetical protein DUI87_17529 [Hirundo rustica rustica]|uniref:Sfi1 spindle body domain-containing protein n=1 Tax=Hirundo rustica rustica TaxID=333673 RepID=A0A3M0K432_HIRRU|nr:hypothetical protein DUI87_17529 [Hirundo rustica rustica]
MLPFSVVHSKEANSAQDLAALAGLCWRSKDEAWDAVCGTGIQGKKLFAAWLQWRELYLYIQDEKQKDTRAITHHQHQELRRCVGAWLGYLNLHRVKKRQNDSSAGHSNIEGNLDGDVVPLCGRRLSLCKRYFNSVTDVVLCVEEAQQCELAEKHYKCHLLELGLKGLRQNVLDTRVQRMRTNLSSRQHRVTVLQKYWNRWKSRLEEKEEEQQQALTSVAHARYRRVLMRQVFDTWLLKACKLQEYRMGEKRIWLTLGGGDYQSLYIRQDWFLELINSLGVFHMLFISLFFLSLACWILVTAPPSTYTQYVGHQREKWRKLVQADLHYRHVLLGKTLAAWKIYQQNTQCILYQVAEKEKQRSQLLLRQVLCTWKQNALALIRESKATAQADEHYRRAILSKVLLQWRDTAWLRACHRRLKVTAVVEARKHLDLVHLQSLFLHWKELVEESLMLRAQHHRAAQHHQQHLLQKYLVKWKSYHQQCLGKKVFDAWLRFAKGQQEKKDGIEKVPGVHHTSTPLREGVTHALRSTAGIHQLQGQLHTQQQLEVKE